jgi:GNAT superfamily N-acetyltransferase
MSARDEGDVRMARVEDGAAIVETLLASFADDPFVAWVVGDRGERARRRYFELTAKMLTLPHGASFTTTGCESVALFATSASWLLSPWAQLAIVPRVARVTGLSRFSEVSHGVELVERGRPREPFLLLTLLGTRPSARGRGLASRVLARGLERCDREGLLCVLDTSNEANLPFYERRGFRITQRVQLPNGPTAWSLVREPAR